MTTSRFGVLAALTLLSVWLRPSGAVFSSSFKQYLLERYGADITAQLERTDIDANEGLVGSYGGGDHVATQKTE